MSYKIIGTGKYIYKVNYAITHKVYDIFDIYRGILLVKADNKKQVEQIAKENILESLKLPFNDPDRPMNIYNLMNLEINNIEMVAKDSSQRLELKIIYSFYELSYMKQLELFLSLGIKTNVSTTKDMVSLFNLTIEKYREQNKLRDVYAAIAQIIDRV